MGAPAVREKLGHKDRSDVYTSRLALTFARQSRICGEKAPCRPSSTYSISSSSLPRSAENLRARAEFWHKICESTALRRRKQPRRRRPFDVSLWTTHSRQPLLRAVDAFRYDVSPMHDAPNCICRVLATWRTSILNRRRLPPQQRRGRVVGNLRVLGGRVVLVCT